MKRYLIMTIAAVLCSVSIMAQDKGYCGTDLQWTWDGKTLSLQNVSKKGEKVSMDDYNRASVAPWKKKGYKILKVSIGKGILNIGSYAFADQKDLSEVVFNGNDMKSIGWAAFMNCGKLRTISLPNQLQLIETIAFVNSGLTAVTIPDHCRVEDQAFVGCKLTTISISPTARIGQYVFANEIDIDGTTRHSLYTGEIRRLPADITMANCNQHGLSKASVEKCIGSGGTAAKDYDYATSDVDSLNVFSSDAKNNTYALIIGNENYRVAADVPYAIHDARVFATYCQKLLGIPSINVHLREDATKYMLMDEAMDWLESIQNRGTKNLIVYYAGHGVPDPTDHKAYLLPTDVNGGEKPQDGVSLDDFYARLGGLGFNQTTVFLDACFSGINRDNEGVTRGTRSVEMATEEGTISNGKMVVISAASSAETAQAYDEQGHGLFTYYLLKTLKDNQGFISLGELSESIENNVKNTAPNLKNKKSQTPTTNASDAADGDWRYWYINGGFQ